MRARSIEYFGSGAYFATNEIPIEKPFSKLTADKERLWSALDLLKQYSMVKVKQGILSIHTLVQQVIRLRLQKATDLQKLKTNDMFEKP